MRQTVSVIIPCYRQAHYLGEAVESALAQAGPHAEIEVVVVDDGSPDDTAAVAARYPGVRYVRQANQGLSAARNTGVRASRGELLVFLDADDRLVPGGVAHGVELLRACPECAFVSGHHRYIRADGSLLKENPPEPIGADHYAALLETNYIGMCATVLYRRQALEAVGPFSTALRSCEDYDMYLRIARRYPVRRHHHVVAEYRRHGTNMSNNAGRMLQTALAVLRAQRPHIRGNPEYLRACRVGVRFWRGYFRGEALGMLQASVAAGSWQAAMRQAAGMAPLAWQQLRALADEAALLAALPGVPAAER